MRKRPAEIISVAKRIADRFGVDVDEVFRRFEAGTKKTRVTASDFFCCKSDISLKGRV